MTQTSESTRRGRRTRLPGLPVRPGSVRRARAEAGLSLAQVAAGEVSRTAIHLIETGKSRPSLPTLELIARRTGRPLDYFLDPEMADAVLGVAPVQRDLDELERLVSFERYDEAIDLAGQVLSRVRDRRTIALAKFWLGQSRSRRWQSDAGLEDLEDARHLFEDLKDLWMVAECLDWEAMARHAAEDPAALEAATQALRLCRDLEPVPRPTELRVLMHLATILIAHHEWEKAVKACEEAIRGWGDLRDPKALARLHDNLNLAYQELGDYQRAAIHSHKAVALNQLGDDRVALIRAENNLGLALMRLGDAQGAETHLRRSRDLAEELGAVQGVAHLLLSLGELGQARGDLDEAERQYSQALVQADETKEEMTAALAHQRLAGVAALRGEHGRADDQFQAALNRLERLDARQRLAECHRAYAELLESRGEVQGSLRHLKEAVSIWQPRPGDQRREAARQAPA
ncbi:MAG: tetratricopeptide repeat protein [Candidatus Dormibacterales bacterium]